MGCVNSSMSLAACILSLTGGTIGVPSTTPTTPAAAGVNVNSTVLILARDSFDVASVSPGLDGYGIPWQQVLIPQAGAPLPTLNSSMTQANYGSIILIGSISYDYNGTYNSALTTAQWDQLYAYQTTFKVRMVRINEYPGPNFGTTVANANSPGCCDDGVTATISLTNTALVPAANLKGYVYNKLNRDITTGT